MSCVRHLAAHNFMLQHELPACTAKQVSWPLHQPAALFLEEEETGLQASGSANSRPSGEEIKKSLNASLLTPVPAKNIKRNYQPSLVLPSCFSTVITVLFLSEAQACPLGRCHTEKAN